MRGGAADVAFRAGVDAIGNGDVAALKDALESPALMGRDSLLCKLCVMASEHEDETALVECIAAFSAIHRSALRGRVAELFLPADTGFKLSVLETLLDRLDGLEFSGVPDGLKGLAVRAGPEGLASFASTKKGARILQNDPHFFRELFEKEMRLLKKQIAGDKTVAGQLESTRKMKETCLSVGCVPTWSDFRDDPWGLTTLYLGREICRATEHVFRECVRIVRKHMVDRCGSILLPVEFERRMHSLSRCPLNKPESRKIAAELLGIYARAGLPLPRMPDWVYVYPDVKHALRTRWSVATHAYFPPAAQRAIVTALLCFKRRSSETTPVSQRLPRLPAEIVLCIFEHFVRADWQYLDQ